MSKDVAIFGSTQLSAEAQEALSRVKGSGDLLAGGGGGTGRRISIRGKSFRQIVGGEQTAVSKSQEMNVIIVKAAAISRAYYADKYVEGEAALPTCWSADTDKPSKDVVASDRQSDTCNTCPQNVKGSGQGESRACRFNQRLAVVLDGGLEKGHVYQLNVPATSIFGDADGNRMPLQAYGNLLRAHDTAPMAIVTELSFDENASTPKLFFRPVRPLEEAELLRAIELSETPEADRAVTFSPGQQDGAKKKEAPALFADPAPKQSAPTEDDAEEEEFVEEPVKASKPKKSKPTPVDDDDIDAMLDDWDD